MSKHAPLSLLSRLTRTSPPSICFRCQVRLLTHSHIRQKPGPSSKPTRATPQALEYRQTSSKRDPDTIDDASQSDSAKYIPQPLGRPIGLPHPPSPGENSGQDNRPARTRYAEILNREKNLEWRKQLNTDLFQKPYFRDWNNMKWNQGKTFVANPRLFRRDRGLWFPNLVGATLAKANSVAEDTTAVLRGKVSVVCIYTGEWARGQVESFVGEKENIGIAEALRENGDVAQRVDVNVEESAMRYWILRPFFYRLRRQRHEKDYGKYFVLTRGISHQIREAIGLLNGKVGYVYLVDGECKIRWAGSGPSWPEEREGMVKGLRRMVQEARERSKTEDEKGAKIENVDLETSSQPIVAEEGKLEKQAAAITS